MDYTDHILQKNNEGHFWYEARKILIGKLFTYISKEQKENVSILDVGCGTGTELELISGFGDLTALDVNEKALEIAKEKGYKTTMLNIENCDLEKNYYNIVCSFDVLEHLNNDYLALKNIYSSIKEDGFFLFSVPAHPSIFSQHDIALEHKRRYTKKELRTKLGDEGFGNIELYYWNSFLFPMIYSLRMFKKIFLKNIKLGSEAKQRNKFINKILFLILKFEATNLFRKRGLPGISIYGIARK